MGFAWFRVIRAFRQCRTVFPEANINRPKPNAKGFTVASGARIPDKGTVETPVKTVEGISTKITWKNADVEMPMLSTHEIAANKNALEYLEDGGTITNLQTKHQTKFIQQNGVYFVKLLIPNSITGDYSLTPPRKEDTNIEGKGFVRP